MRYELPLAAALVVTFWPGPGPSANVAADEPAALPSISDTTPAGAESGSAPVRALEIPRHKLTPMMADLVQIVEYQDAELAAIRRAIASAHDPVRLLELHQRIESIKRDTELQLLRVQAMYARREGRVQAAEGLEASIRSMTVRRSPAASPEPAPQDGIAP